MGKSYDFSGWATRFDRLCSDGRTIRDGAFDDDDGKQVPLIWQHYHDSPDMVLGHALLEKRPGEGMYAYCSFNNTERAQAAKESVRHGDVTSLSIHANRLKQSSKGDVLHGSIREVSLVLTGANPEAKIDIPVILHSDDSEGNPMIDDVVIFSGEDIVDISGISHSEEDTSDDTLEHSEGKSINEVWKTLNDEQQRMVYTILLQAFANDAIEHGDTEDTEETVEDILETLNEKQKAAVFAIVKRIKNDPKAETINHSDDDGTNFYEEEMNNMRRNVFEQDTAYTRPQYELTHADFEEIVQGARRTGSMRDSFREFIQDKCDELMHSADVERGELGDATYGIADIDWLFPEAHVLDNPPEWIKRDTGWVTEVMSTVHHTPFSRIKSRFADITEDEARAKGYLKGNKKTEEVFTLIKRTTTPCTVYKKQRLDRDDKLDITDFDVVAWLKSEMRLMLDEELARAYLVGDGRNALSNDKIDEDHIRPIWTDDDLFTIHYTIEVAADADEDTVASDTIRAAIKSRKDYKGSGNPVMFMDEAKIIDMLLLEDGIGNRKYKTRDELATACGVRKIVPVPIFENLSRTVVVDGQEQTRDLVGIIVNMGDYNVGADKGGAVEMFEDFDIDYNQEKYLIETRCSGALTKPFSAIALELHRATT